jgi:hypothetical protein
VGLVFLGERVVELPACDVLMRHRNPGATADLVIPVQVVCNTPEEVLIENITINSARQRNWLKAEDPHSGVAIICGSGPSIAEDLALIRRLHRDGGKIFALNGCASFLAKNGIMPDYQVICDARPENVQLIGAAKHHLFASQCHPSLFATVNAQLWHLQIGEIERYFPDYQGAYVLIGGAASVGNVSLCLTYAMGYRELHLFGMDSCHKEGVSHAFPQPLNDGDPTCITEFQGKKYLASLTMRHQAEKFQETARAVQQMGAKIHVHGYGLLPDMWRAPKVEMTEKDKYDLMWQEESYRRVSPGEGLVDTFIDWVRPTGTVIDFGCGTGRAGLAMKRRGLGVTLVDFTSGSRDPEAELLPFFQLDITKRPPFSLSAKYGFCTDVLEHIPPEDIKDAIYFTMRCVDECFYQISLVPDVMGTLIGQDLHLTVHPYFWWLDLFRSMGYWVRRSEDQGQSALFHVAHSGAIL